MVTPVTNETDIWLLVDANHPDFSRMIADATLQHKEHWAHAQLSVTLRLDGLVALVKARGGRDWQPQWRVTSLVNRIFTPADHHEAQVLVKTVAWEPLDPE